MDELFFLPPAPVAMPRAFWLHDKGDNFLSSQLIVIQPSEPEWQRIEAAIAHHGPNDFDMEIVNDLYGSSCIILPHRRYDLLTCEFRAESHASYLGSEHEEWNADAVLAEAKFVHFSDWPYPKPWLKASASETERSTPKCNDGSGGEQCKNGEAWLELYKEFSDRRQVCASCTPKGTVVCSGADRNAAVARLRQALRQHSQRPTISDCATSPATIEVRTHVCLSAWSLVLSTVSMHLAWPGMAFPRFRPLCLQSVSYPQFGREAWLRHVADRTGHVPPPRMRPDRTCTGEYTEAEHSKLDVSLQNATASQQPRRKHALHSVSSSPSF